MKGSYHDQQVRGHREIPFLAGRATWWRGGGRSQSADRRDHSEERSALLFRTRSDRGPNETVSLQSKVRPSTKWARKVEPEVIRSERTP